MPVEKAGQPRKQGSAAESPIVSGVITIASLSPHTSIGSWRIERLAHQMPDSLNYRVGPQPGVPLYVPDAPNNRGPQAREPSKPMNRQSYGERPAKEVFWSPATRGSRKDFDRSVTPVVEAVCVTAQTCHLRTWCRQGPCKSSSCATFMLNSHWGRAATGKKVWPLCVQGHFGSVWLPDPVDCGLWVSLSGRGVLQARILERIAQYWLPYLSRVLYFLLP